MQSLSLHRSLLILLLICGVGLPMSEFVPWLRAHGLAPRLFLAELLVTPISRFFALDVMLSGLVVCLFARSATRRACWLVVAATCLLGPCVGLPLLLLLRADTQTKS